MDRLLHLFRKCLILWLVLGALAWAGPTPEGGAAFLSDAEFQRLAEELAPKVNLFEEAWEKDSEAEFYGGTTRDYLYWLKGKLALAKSHEQALKIAERLKSLPVIDVKDFLMHESDVDISSRKGVSISAQDFGVKKIDSIQPDIFDPTTEKGLNERTQGYIPAEKIRLGKKGFILDPEFGNGISEIHSGRLTVHFTSPEVFAKSHYAQKKLNHPILLALRYLRLQAINYFKTYGDGYPDLEKLLDMEPKSKEAVEQVIQKCLDGKELKEFLGKEQFAKWLNGSIRKGFRSYTNPTAMMELMKAFHANELISRYNGLNPINQFLFAKYRDPNQAAANFQKFGVTAETLYEPVAKHFSDGRYYHGTSTDEGFRDILLQGIRPSEGGAAGDGLYGVSTDHRKYSEEHYCGGDPNRLVSFQVDPDAHIVDITQDRGRKLYEKFHRATGGNESDFAEAFGIDIIRYDFDRSTPRYIAKNAAVLGEPKGVYRHVLTFSKAVEWAEKLASPQELSTFIESLKLSRFRTSDLKQIAKSVPKELLFGPLDYFRALSGPGGTRSSQAPFFPFYRMDATHPGQEQEVFTVAISVLAGPDKDRAVVAWFGSPLCLQYPEVLRYKLETGDLPLLKSIYEMTRSGSAPPGLRLLLEREDEKIVHAIKNYVGPKWGLKTVFEDAGVFDLWLGYPTSVKHPEVLRELNSQLLNLQSEHSKIRNAPESPFRLERFARKYPHWEGKGELFQDLRADLFEKLLDRGIFLKIWIGWLYSPSARKDPRWPHWRGKLEEYFSNPKKSTEGDYDLHWKTLLKCKTPDEFITKLVGDVVDPANSQYELDVGPVGNYFSALDPSIEDWKKLRRDCWERNKSLHWYEPLTQVDLNLRAVEARDAKTPAEVIDALSLDKPPKTDGVRARLEGIANQSRERFLSMNPTAAEKTAFEKAVAINRGDYGPFGETKLGCLYKNLVTGGRISKGAFYRVGGATVAVGSVAALGTVATVGAVGTMAVTATQRDKEMRKENRTRAAEMIQSAPGGSAGYLEIYHELLQSRSKDKELRDYAESGRFWEDFAEDFARSNPTADQVARFLGFTPVESSTKPDLRVRNEGARARVAEILKSR